MIETLRIADLAIVERVELEFDRGLIEASGLRAPFLVRHLGLRDQGRLAVLE